MRNDLRFATLAGVLALTASSGAWACTGAGVITRIEGRPQDIIISRSGAPVPRPRVLEVMCEGDVVRVQNGATASLSIDGVGPVKVQGAQGYTVGARKNAPSLAGNAYKNVSEKVMPDMKRQPWDVRLRGPGPALGFALTSLSSGKQQIAAGRRDLLVRLDGGIGSYQVDLLDANGTLVATGQGRTDVVLKGVTLAPGVYTIKATDGSNATVKATVKVVADRPPVSKDYDGISDAEVQAAAVAADLARTDPEIWALEAEQVLAGAAVNGLDRESVYELIESYGVA